MNKTTIITTCLMAAYTIGTNAQSFEWISSTEGETWKEQRISLKASTSQDAAITTDKNQKDIVTFKAWGTCFNELGWDALNMLPRKQQENILKQLFSPQGDMRMTLGRIPMNANDYARNWYSCDEVPGDFELKYFNIDRDKTTLIPYIKAAQQYCPDMRFWISPWSPPSWMKANQYYSVRSDKNVNQMNPKSDVLLYGSKEQKVDKSVFPQKLAVTDYLIQDPRYLQAYADYFCRFIDAYKAEGIPISTVMYQNEAWSYTNYPGCAWTVKGIVRFNTEYLGPTLKKKHPEVDLYFGTINTNRYDFIDEVLSDPLMPKTVKGIGLQWEGRQILAQLRQKYPSYKYVQTESECGWGSFDWKAAEHTFSLMTHYLGNGCEEYTFWNAILADNGVSGWGWKQNALIRVDSKRHTATYTPEYQAVRHYCHYIGNGTRILAFEGAEKNKTPILVTTNSKGKYVITAGNFNDSAKQVSINLGKKHLTATLKPHSLNTFVEK